jgi:hypothetical protein
MSEVEDRGRVYHVTRECVTLVNSLRVWCVGQRDDMGCIY